jgi:STE24 endopeptidase
VQSSDVKSTTYSYTSQAYGRAKSNFSFINSLFSQVTNIATIHFDLLPKLWKFAGHLITQYAPPRFSGEISQSIVFFTVFTFATSAISLPLSYYKTFVLEEKFGFNKQTKKLVRALRMLSDWRG